MRMRTLVAVGLVAVASCGLFHAAPKRADLWVLQHHVPGIDTIAAVYEDRADADAVAHRIADTADQWNIVTRAPFFKKNDPLALGLLVPLQAASLTVTPQTAVVLPAQSRNGEFISPSVNVGAGVSEIILTANIDAGDYENASKGLSVACEYSTDGEVTWPGGCGGFGWHGGHFVGKDGTIDPLPVLHSIVANWPGFPIRLRVQTCLPIDACTPGPIVTGATIEVK